MADVRLDFIAPNLEGLAKLHIFESATQTGSFSPIEEVTAIGTYPNYISYYTTQLASSVSNWFAIEWEDEDGALLGISQAIQGNVRTLVGEIVARVLLRDPTIKEGIAEQEAEALVEQFFNTTDALSIMASEATAQQLSGLTLLTIVRSKLVTISQASNDGYTAGLVSQQGSSSTSTSLDNLKYLLTEASKLLGLSYSVVLQMAENEIAGGSVVIDIPDQSRLLTEIL